MKRYVVLEKDIGETPLQAVERWRAAHSEYADVPACYAGRLDPMASGKLLVLLGDECKRQEQYHDLDKEYEIEVLLDFGSDTGDVLGLVEYAGKETRPDESTVRRALKSLTGAHRVPYPAFSSKTVAGKPLFLYALEGALDSIEIPEHIERIYRIQLLGMERLDAAALRDRINALLAKAPKTDEESKALGADFRIHAVRNSWQIAYLESDERSFTVLRLHIACTSGTYMRTLAGRLGTVLGTKALALSIHRTRVGRFAPSFGMWFRGLRRPKWDVIGTLAGRA